MTKAVASICKRSKAYEEDAVISIYLYEESLCTKFGSSVLSFDCFLEEGKRNIDNYSDGNVFKLISFFFSFFYSFYFILLFIFEKITEKFLNFEMHIKKCFKNSKFK